MIEVTIEPAKIWDEDSEKFVLTIKKPITLQLEHSLISLSKWESIHCKAFLKDDPKNPKTAEDIVDYIRCMTISPKHLDPNAYYAISKKDMDRIMQYVEKDHTATTFHLNNKNPNAKAAPGGHKDTVTSELIYYWMTEFGIPFECERWNLSRLLTLIHICQVKTAPAKEMPKGEIYNQNKSLNAMRRKAMHSKG